MGRRQGVLGKPILPSIVRNSCWVLHAKPFASILRNPDTYERFEEVLLVYGCHQASELAYATKTVVALRESEFLGVQADRQLVYYASVTREAFHHTGRITDLITSGKLAHDLGRPALSAEDDRVMICGNPEMLVELKAELVGWGFGEGSSGEPGAFVIEKAFAER